MPAITVGQRFKVITTMWREEAFLRDEARADYYEDRARLDAAMGNYGAAAIDEVRSEVNRFEAAADLVNPFPHHNRLENEIIAAEVVLTENAIERERIREIREMELARDAYGVPPGGVGAYYPPGQGYVAPVEVLPTNVYPNAYPQPYPYPPPGTGYAGVPGYPPY